MLLMLANTYDRFKRTSNVITSIQLYSRMIRLERIVIEDYIRVNYKFKPL
jgi:hypothetical protein